MLTTSRSASPVNLTSPAPAEKEKEDPGSSLRHWPTLPDSRKSPKKDLAFCFAVWGCWVRANPIPSSVQFWPTREQGGNVKKATPSPDRGNPRSGWHGTSLFKRHFWVYRRTVGFVLGRDLRPWCSQAYEVAQALFFFFDVDLYPEALVSSGVEKAYYASLRGRDFASQRQGTLVCGSGDHRQLSRPWKGITQ